MVSWDSVYWPFRASIATLALKSRLCFLSPYDISCSFPTAKTAFSVGAGLSHSYMYEIQGPSHTQHHI